MRSREKNRERKATLAMTEQGRALIRLDGLFETRSELAECLGIPAPTITSWFHKGQISRSGCIRIEEVLGIDKEDMRPDLSPSDWAAPIPGRKFGNVPNRNEPDCQILSALKDHFGSVSRLCQHLGIRVGLYHNWNSRGRISERAIRRMIRDDDIPDPIRRRLESLISLPPSE